jgi:hypothetical protein
MAITLARRKDRLGIRMLALNLTFCCADRLTVALIDFYGEEYPI